MFFNLLIFLGLVRLYIVEGAVKIAVAAAFIDQIVANRLEGKVRSERIKSVDQGAVVGEGGIRTDVVQLHTVHRRSDTEKEKTNKSDFFHFLIQAIN